MNAATEKMLTPDNCVVAIIDHQPQKHFHARGGQSSITF